MQKLTKPLTAFFEPTEAKELRLLSAQLDMSRSNVIRLACKDFIEKMKREKEVSYVTTGANR